ncbi:hypothetical protein CY34DRAFT_325007 [Suillus luteus UH-Slu-Lm8-n1]|uniref:Uncharacterized protein n=1 Tax=Suillus luteus UH-Slu-Lm8-n1 TaxID=930992 RepID=A0A0D0ANM6_9AGAM|nr:hypothetical protein CY34DRAFT_325007 [Suillus luteus UH-Slu-Lm8-n1]
MSTLALPVASPRMLVSKCVFARNQIQLRSGITELSLTPVTATFDFWPQTRHHDAVRATPHGEKPESVQGYESRTGKVVKDRRIEIWKEQGIEIPQSRKGRLSRACGYND